VPWTEDGAAAFVTRVQQIVEEERAKAARLAKAPAEAAADDAAKGAS